MQSIITIDPEEIELIIIEGLKARGLIPHSKVKFNTTINYADRGGSDTPVFTGCEVEVQIPDIGDRP